MGNEKATDEELNQVIKMAHLDEFAHSLEKGLDTYVGERGTTLSGGQRQAASLLMATIAQPKLLLLDEPAAGMNPQETAELTETIRFVRDNFDMTVLLIEHDMSLVSKLCDELTVLNFGTTLAHGKVEDVLNDPEVVRAYLGE